ncbi:hypothetical protein ACFW1A_31670 [Kitasatospora sp. NPDC058965]|uniref:hypothetical protein n=1 Tax=Kitasatospora sp. NPDC058965 TaxID=3346682 RepID=UPI00367C808A
MDGTTATADDFLDRALLEEAVKKSGLLWVRAADGASAQPLWHAWYDGAVVLVGDGGEQPLHGLRGDGTAVVTVRSKDKWGRLVAFVAEVSVLEPGSEAWTGAVEELKAKRLNAPDTDTITERWAAECRVLRLLPTGGLTERPGAMPTDSHAAQPLPSPVTTRQPIPAGLPKLVLGRLRRKG